MVSDRSSFPASSEEWARPEVISNAIIDIGADLPSNINQILEQLNRYYCHAVQVRIIATQSKIDIVNIINLFAAYPFRLIEVYLKFDNWMTLDALREILSVHPNVNSVLVCSSLVNSQELIVEEKNRGVITFFTDSINFETGCGIVSSKMFIIGQDFYTESLHHNTCLNRKISIDKDGYIKNCPSMKHHFGHISEVKLEGVIQNPEFTKYWNIKKDEISKCKDCEFRHVCTDCRAYLENPEDLYSAPLKCGYDPYTNVWEEWSTNPLKAAAIEYYGMEDLQKKEK